MPEFLTVEPGRGEGRGGKNREYPKKEKSKLGLGNYGICLMPSLFAKG